MRKIGETTRVFRCLATHLTEKSQILVATCKGCGNYSKCASTVGRVKKLFKPTTHFVRTPAEE